jgi:hypothetical protein
MRRHTGQRTDPIIKHTHTHTHTHTSMPKIKLYTQAPLSKAGLVLFSLRFCCAGLESASLLTKILRAGL